MADQFVDNGGVRLYACSHGVQAASAPTVVFANALGTTTQIWDAILPLLPPELRIICYDLRGHGTSDAPQGRYTMGQLVSDAEAICDAYDVSEAMFVGLSVGGMIAQGLAVKRPDLIRAMVLSNTAAKIGNPPLWQNRIDTVLAKGMDHLADNILDRWFGRDFMRTGHTSPWRDMISRCNPIGYAGVCAAISGTDFYTPTSGLRIPTLGIAGAEDGATPADLVRETTDLIPGATFKVMRRCGHLPCVEDPEGYADILTEFMTATGHLGQGLQ